MLQSPIERLRMDVDLIHSWCTIGTLPLARYHWHADSCCVGAGASLKMAQVHDDKLSERRGRAHVNSAVPASCLHF